MDQPRVNTNLNELMRHNDVLPPSKILEERRKAMQQQINDGEVVMVDNGKYVSKDTLKPNDQKQKFLRDIHIRIESDSIENLRSASDMIEGVMGSITFKNADRSPDQLVNYSITNKESIKQED